MTQVMKSTWNLVKQSGKEWNDDNALRLSAALSYYTVFSLAPLILLVTAVVGLFLGEEAARGELSHQLQGLLGAQGAEAIESVVAGARSTSSGIIATIIGFVVLIIGATGVFAELKAALNQIWEATPKMTNGVLSMIKDRLLSFAMVLSVGFLFLVSLLANTALAAAGKYMGGFFPAPPFLFQMLELVVSFGVITLLFAMIFKFLPDIEIEWKDVWMGAVVTAFLFTVGKLIIGLYLGKSTVASTFGAAASVVVVMVWSYYSSLILFFGAEFTQVYARNHGSRSHETGLKEKAKEIPGTLKQREASSRGLTTAAGSAD